MLVFSLTAVITVLFVGGWAILCVYRLFFAGDISYLERSDWESGKMFHYDEDAALVSVQEIYEQTYEKRGREEIVEYSYERGSRANLPSAWWEDLRRRRN